MQLPRPYFHTSERMIGLVDRPQMMPAEGLVIDPVYGYHTLWIAEVPFIPAHVDSNGADFNEDASIRITRVLQRQVRFLYDLAQSREHLSTLELRLVSWPQPTGVARVGIAFLGKTFHADEQTSRQLALGLWDKFSAIFPREAPFSYPLVPVTDFDKAANAQDHSFKEWYEPIPFDQLTRPQSIVELRKYEDWPTIRDIGGVLHARDYIPHPFVAALDHSAMARLFETMARQSETCVVAITLRPQRLTDQEVVILHELAGWYQRTARGEVTVDNPLVDVLRELKSDIFDSYIRARAELGRSVYENLVREHRSLFLVRLQVIGEPAAQDDLVEALGSEVMANAGSAYPSRWTRVEPTPDELRWARFNLQWLEFARWGISRLIQQDRRIIRLRQLATVPEAAGAFRLPVAPSSGGLAGLEVRDEPFSLPTAIPTRQTTYLTLWTILDRGVPTGIPFFIPLNALAGLSQVFGDANEAREQVLQELLGGAKAAGIPWILIRKANIFNTDIAGQLKVRHILVDDALGTSSLSFQPFLPPPGVPVTKFLDALLRIFIASYALDGATSAPLRRALIETYENAGWTEQSVGRTIDLAELAARIDAVTQQPDVPTEIAGMLRTRCALPLRDLATTATRLLEVPSGQTNPWSEATILEVGWVGSDINNILVRACLWAWVTLSLASVPTPGRGLRGIVALEEAHAIFGSRSSLQTTGSSVASLVHSSTYAGVGTLLIDERSDLLDTEITSRAGVTILTHNVNLAALEHIATLIGTSPRQRARISRLGTMEAVVAVRGAAPALVRL
jgi:hypothetical protein